MILMTLIFHVVIALLSMLSVTWAYVFPSRRRLQISAAMIGLTLASGTYLVVSLHARLLQACVTGLLYLAVVAGGLLLARYRLVRQEAAAAHRNTFSDR